jgi:hypothetical protein
MKNETLGEAAERYIDCFEFGIAHPRRVAKNAFINGAKYQAERMYNEEDMREAFRIGFNFGYNDAESPSYLTFEKLFEQFKK